MRLSLKSVSQNRLEASLSVVFSKSSSSGTRIYGHVWAHFDPVESVPKYFMFQMKLGEVGDAWLRILFVG